MTHILTNHQDGSWWIYAPWILMNPRFHVVFHSVFYMFSIVHPIVIAPNFDQGLFLTFGQVAATAKVRCLQVGFPPHSSNRSPGEPNCHMLDEEWRGHVSCKVFCTRDVSTFGNYQASIIIHSCFCNAHRASHFANLTGTCMRQLSEMEMCGACRKLKDVRMRYQDHENRFDSWTMMDHGLILLSL